jgi:hypothetical protein
VAGELAERTGTFDAALVMVAGIMAVGLLCLLAMGAVRAERARA